MEDEQRLTIMEAVAQGLIQGINGNENRLFGNRAIRPDSFPLQLSQLVPMKNALLQSWQSQRMD